MTSVPGTVALESAVSSKVDAEAIPDGMAAAAVRLESALRIVRFVLSITGLTYLCIQG